MFVFDKCLGNYHSKKKKQNFQFVGIVIITFEAQHYSTFVIEQGFDLVKVTMNVNGS
jgi:hypothetical protein